VVLVVDGMDETEQVVKKPNRRTKKQRHGVRAHKVVSKARALIPGVLANDENLPVGSYDTDHMKERATSLNSHDTPTHEHGHATTLR
jgi:hypothetical protein